MPSQDDAAVRLDPALRVIAFPPSGEESPVALLQTSAGVEAITGLDPATLKTLLAAIEQQPRRRPLLEALEAKGFDRASAADVVELLRSLGAVQGGRPGPDAAPAPWQPAAAPLRGALRYERVLILGEGALGQALLEGCQQVGATASLVEVRAGGKPKAASGEELYRAAGAALPIAPAFTSEGKPLSDAQLRARFEGAELVIFAAGLGTYEGLFSLRDAIAAAGARLLAITGAGDALEVGPLALPSAGPLLEQSRFSLLEGREAGPLRPLVGALALPRLSASPRVFGAAAELVASVLLDPALTLLHRVLKVSDDGLADRPATSAAARERWTGAERELDLFHHLHPRLRADPGLFPKIRKALQAGELVIIRDAFAPELAEAMHRALDTSTRWRVFAEQQPGFHFHHHNLYEPREYPPELTTFVQAADSDATRAMIERLTGERCEGQTQTGASWYMPGDHSTPHSDFAVERRIAFVWHLTRDWRPDWGGDLFWSASGTPVPPSFNTLCLFKVTRHSSHFVVHVAPHALGKRLAVNGWWRGEDTETDAELPTGPRSLEADGKVSVLPAGRCVVI